MFKSFTSKVKYEQVKNFSKYTMYIINEKLISRLLLTNILHNLLHSDNTYHKGMHPTISPPLMGKY